MCSSAVADWSPARASPVAPLPSQFPSVVSLHSQSDSAQSLAFGSRDWPHRVRGLDTVSPLFPHAAIGWTTDHRLDTSAKWRRPLHPGGLPRDIVFVLAPPQASSHQSP